MKFLVVNRVCFLFLVSFLYPFNCIDNWYQYFIKESIDKIVHIQGTKNNFYDSSFSEEVEIYFFNHIYNFRIDINNQILLFDTEKSTKIFKETNQLFIDETDSLYIDIIR